MDALEALLGGSDSNGSILNPSDLFAPLMPFIVIISIVSVVIAILYVVNIVTTFRSHKATIETRDILREMNERDKARGNDSASKVSALLEDTPSNT